MSTLGDNPKLKAIFSELHQLVSYPQERLTPHEKRSLLEACRQGTAPNKGATYISVGREEFYLQFESDLDDISLGDSRLRILHGVYGMGKSFLARLGFERAVSLGFAASFVTLSARESPLSNLAMIYKQIAKNIRTKDSIDQPALELILSAWAERVRHEAVRTGQTPWLLQDLNHDFKSVLEAYYDATNSGRGHTLDLALRWLQAEDADLRSAKSLGVNSKIDNANALNMLGNLTKMLKFMGLKGLVIMIDEVDQLSAIPAGTRRMQAYQNLKRLSDGTYGLPFAYFVLAASPAFFDNSQSDLSWAASPKVSTALHGLTDGEYQVLAQRLWQLHQDVYGYEDRAGASRNDIRTFVRRYLKQARDRMTTRNFVRAIVSAADLCQQFPDVAMTEVKLSEA